jgi:trk system potassium uptake protein TrkH
MNFKNVISILGVLIALNGFFMFLGVPFSMYYGESTHPLLISGGVSILLGIFLWQFFKMKSARQELSKKDGYLVVALGWLMMSIFGMLPFLISGSITGITDAFFETISGFTTTGASILNDIEGMPKGLLFWRSMTQWIGGMGIIVLTVALVSIIGVGGMQLFVAEAPGISPDKLKPRIKDTAKRLWLIYLGLTLSETVFLMFGGMTFYDAINHSLTTMATGGFSTKNASMAHFDSPYIQYVVIVFMFLAGVNFTLTYFGLKFKLKKVWANEEFKAYISTVGLFTIIITIGIVVFSNTPYEKAFRDAAFQVVSVITTTGFITADYTSWAPIITVLFFFFMFIGGSSGSTAGGVKIVRHVILFKNSFLEMKRLLHPTSIIPVRLNKKAITQSTTFNVLAFIMIYISVFVFGSIAVSLTGVDFTTTIGAVATSLGNIGPGLGTVGPIDNFSHLPDMTKWILAGLMLLGRLELFTVLILFTPYFWKKV